ncbi:MAG: tetratricopeptide repeat protein [Bacteroidia bacterium]|nr:tetratricopeptide repeat protein [Bacteroidia bacterium]MDW8347638.1 tetratricopeptide repeat protein [Bacteroidia bacterium]
MLRRLVVIILTFTIFSLVSAQRRIYTQQQIDSLKNVVESMSDKDTNKILLSMILGEALIERRNGLDYFNQAMSISLKTGWSYHKNEINADIGRYYYVRGEYEEAMNYATQALKEAESEKDIKGIIKTKNLIGLVYKDKNNLDASINTFYEAINLARSRKDNFLLGDIYMNIGLAFKKMGKLDSALHYQRQSLSIHLQQKAYLETAKNYNYIGQIYVQTNQKDSARIYLSKSQDMAKKLQANNILIEVYNGLADLETQNKKHKEAIELREKALKMATQDSLKNEMLICFQGLAYNYTAINKIDRAFYYMKQENNLRQRMLLDRQSDVLAKYELEKREADIALLKKQRLFQRTLFIAMGIGFCFIVVFAIVLYTSNLRRKKANQLLQEKNTQIELQKQQILEQTEELRVINEQLEQKTNEILSSIRYGKRIQSAILPYGERISKSVSDFFVLYIGRDGLSGDFYWFADKDGVIIMAGVDCTGHGIPGALISMIGDALMNHIVHERKIYEPKDILYHLNNGVCSSLQQENDEIKDGMDAVICTWYPRQNKLLFAGAMNPLYYTNSQGLHEIKADKHAVGGEKNKEFTQHTIWIYEPTTLYLTSDGYADQFGGPENKKLGRKRMKELFLQIKDMPMYSQYNVLRNTFETWKGHEEQVDDVLIFGVKIGT